jgi:hypothetical protein
MAPQAEGYVGGPNKPAFEKQPDLEGKVLSSQQKTNELVIDCIPFML